MTKFIFKSNASDLQKIMQSIEIIQKNTLYCTYRIDALLKKVNTMVNDKGLQKQVDQYFGDDSEHFEETSPQTDDQDQITKEGFILKDE